MRCRFTARAGHTCQHMPPVYLKLAPRFTTLRSHETMHAHLDESLIYFTTRARDAASWATHLGCQRARRVRSAAYFYYFHRWPLSSPRRYRRAGRFAAVSVYGRKVSRYFLGHCSRRTACRHFTPLTVTYYFYLRLARRRFSYFHT